MADGGKTASIRDSGAEFTFALAPITAVLPGAQRAAPVRRVDSIPNGFLHHGIQRRSEAALLGANIEFVVCVALYAQEPQAQGGIPLDERGHKLALQELGEFWERHLVPGPDAPDRGVQSVTLAMVLRKDFFRALIKRG